MIIVDTNILLYAAHSDSEFHPKAKAWVEAVMQGSETVAFSWTVVLAFIRLSTNRRIFQNPLSPEQAVELVEDWLGQPHCMILEPGPRHLILVRDLLSQVGFGGDLVPDAHLAALAIENRGEVCSFDGDFNLFPGVRWRNPLL
jgi:uncharacterized protein